MTSKVIIFRFILGLLMMALVMEGWWFIALIPGIIGVLKFRFYFEILLAGIFYDSLFGFAPSLGWKGYLGTIICALAVLVGLAVKRVMR